MEIDQDQDQDQKLAPTSIRTCPQCGEPAELQQVERLPSNGTLVIAIHQDQSYCKFAEYDSIDDLEYKRGDKGIKIKECPVCPDHRAGIANAVRPGKEDLRKRTSVTYRVGHKEGLPKWCYVKTQQDRDTILKAFGRYLETPKVDIINHKPKALQKPPVEASSEDQSKSKKKRGPYKRRSKTQKRLDRARRLKMKSPPKLAASPPKIQPPPSFPIDQLMFEIIDEASKEKPDRIKIIRLAVEVQKAVKR